MIKLKTLNEVFDEFEDDLFSNVNSVDISEVSAVLSEGYFEHSGNKPCAKQIMRYIEKYGKTATIDKIGLRFDALFGENAQKVMDALAQNYNAAECVDEQTVEEETGANTLTRDLADATSETTSGTNNTTRTPNLTDTHNRTLNLSDSETEAATDDGTTTYNTSDATTHNTTDAETKNLTTAKNKTNATTTDEHTFYGFNSQAAVPADGNTQTVNDNETVTETGTDTMARTGTDTTAKTGTEQTVRDIDRTNTQTHTGTDNLSEQHTGTEQTAQTTGSTASGSATHTGTEANENERSLVIHRHGNVGTVSVAKLLTEELVFREKYTFAEYLYTCFDKILTIPIYQ